MGTVWNYHPIHCVCIREILILTNWKFFDLDKYNMHYYLCCYLKLKPNQLLYLFIKLT